MVPLRLLVIEDRESDFELLEQQLQRQGLAATCHQVDTPADLQVALDDPDWDAVLTDYNIPGMGFQDTVATLRARRPELPIVLVSGYMGEDQAALLFDSGIADFVLKYRPARLSTAIRRAVADARAEQARRAAEAALRASELRLQEALRSLETANARLEDDVATRTVELRRQTNYLLTLIDNLPFRVWLKDTDGRFLAVNRAHAALYGCRPQDIVGKTDFDLVDEETAHARILRDRGVMQSGRPATHEMQTHRTELAGWIESYKAPVFDAAGNVLGTIGYARDITEHKAGVQVRADVREPRTR
jgi:two-component system, sensor histidine kinase and response regulator